MRQCVDGRKLITLHGEGFPIRGTYHPARDEGIRLDERRRIGVLFLNSLSLPRAATGDSAVEWAESLAETGYPCFRVDLPGLGDSAGDLPSDLLNYINEGGFARAASEIARLIKDQFDLKGIVIAGHCAGAVSALFAADITPECKGLVLMDMYFHLPQAVRPKFRRYMSDWALKSALGRLMSKVYDRIRQLNLNLQPDNLPENANLRLLRCWKRVASSGQPILMLKAPARKAVGTKPRAGEFDYLNYAMNTRGPQARVQLRFAAGTDHSFANRKGRASVRCEIGTWLDTYFADKTKLTVGNPVSPHPVGEEIAAGSLTSS